ncbi:HSP20-like chaperone [Pseudocohnilembus persalinus]|uniref:HSP20-like chaperone n=1 Tax=Pseudocohnilembus persalinus TaxID=266149 RepID=A0A0V0QMT4_PSEPJ|nr:HSP20-like chaperone [Pseudocohnilembus persalinus]|eukprot:KRX03579.1 HSP20-like chaperone [Pseudocohnilembus persalinus]
MQIQKIRPVVEWAQNKQSIFLSMKKALRKDAPGCMDCNKDETIQIENQKIFASSYGVITHQPVQWILDLELEQEIIPEQSTWLEQGQGTFFFNLTKAQNGTLWENLEKNTTKQHGIWWDMQQKFKKDFDEWNKRRDGTYVPEQENNEENKHFQNSDGENTLINQETINFQKDGELSQNNNFKENHSQIKNSDNDIQKQNQKELDLDSKQQQQNRQEDL